MIRLRKAHPLVESRNQLSPPDRARLHPSSCMLELARIEESAQLFFGENGGYNKNRNVGNMAMGTISGYPKRVGPLCWDFMGREIKA